MAGRSKRPSNSQSTCCMRVGVSGWNNFPILFSLYVTDMPSSSHHVELARYADDPAMIATYRQPALLNHLSHVPAT